MSVAQRLWRLIRDTGTQIFSGTKQLYQDKLKYTQIIQKIKKDELAIKHLPITDALHIYTYRRNRAKFATSTLPVLIFFAFPVVGYAAIPLFLKFPQKFLVGPMMSSEQRLDVQNLRYQKRRQNYKTVLLLMRESLLQSKKEKEVEDLQKICLKTSQKIDPCDIIDETIPFFKLGSWSLTACNRESLIAIAACCEILNYKFMPSFALRRAIERRSQEYMDLIDSIAFNIATSNSLANWSKHEMQSLVFELLHGKTTDDPDLEVSLSRIKRFASLLVEHEKELSPDTKSSLVIHGLIYLATRQNK